MRKTALICFAVLGLTFGVHAQDSKFCKFPANLEKLAAKATEVVEVTLDENMLKFAGNFLNKDKQDEDQARKLLVNLRSICVRSLKFEKDGQYALEDVETLRSQFRAPTWSKMVGVHSKQSGKNVDVLLRMDKNAVTGLAVIAAEPVELTFVHIDGVIDPSQLTELGGQFGIPKVEMPPKSKPAAKADSK
jgi:hypothetical protein